MKHLIILTCGALIAGTASAQSVTEWDSDASGDLSRDEWNTGFGGDASVGNWDADANASISGSEFSKGLFARFDADGDGSLTSEEWDNGFARWHGDSTGGVDFATWDNDGDGNLTESEFEQQFQSAGMFDQFRTRAGLDASADGIATDDLGRGMFDWMDRNDDDVLASDEAT